MSLAAPRSSVTPADAERGRFAAPGGSGMNTSTVSTSLGLDMAGSRKLLRLDAVMRSLANGFSGQEVTKAAKAAKMAKADNNSRIPSSHNRRKSRGNRAEFTIDWHGSAAHISTQSLQSLLAKDHERLSCRRHR